MNMHIHKYEKIWLIFGSSSLIFFLSYVVVSAFYIGNQPPSCLTTIDPEKVDETAPFNKPGWIGITVALILFAYTIPLIDMIEYAPPASKGFW